jgi:divalent metal cation (Fe/Co/Zn/Cd) transporter
MRSVSDELRIEIRKAIQAVDPKLKIENIEKLMDAVEEQIKNRLQERKKSADTTGAKNPK